MKNSYLILDCEYFVDENYLTEITQKFSVRAIYTYNSAFYKSYCEKQNIDLIEVSSHRDYLQFRKYFYYKLEKCFTQENKQVQNIFDICKYTLLFQNEIIYHKIWLLERLEKTDKLNIVFLSDKSDLSKKQRQSLFPEEVIKIFTKEPRRVFRSDILEFYREHIRRLKNFKYKKPIEAYANNSIFFIENIDNNINVGKWFKAVSSKFKNKISIINLNQNSPNHDTELNYYTPGIINYITALIETTFWLIKLTFTLKFKTFNNNRVLRKSIMSSLAPMLFELMYYKRYANLLVKKTDIAIAMSTNYSSIYSRIFSEISNTKKIKTVYLQHGLLECLEYLMDFKQEIINLWGMIYFPYLKNKASKRIFLGNILDCSKANKNLDNFSHSETGGSLNSLKNILFLPSRTGGNIVSVAENKFMFNILYKSISELNKREGNNNYHLIIKLHPNDTKSIYAFSQNEEFLTITNQHDSKYWISRSDICIASNSTAGSEICYYLKPFIFFTTSKTVTIIESYENYGVGIGVNSVKEMIIALKRIEEKHRTTFIDKMKVFNEDFAQKFELEGFEKILSE
jgi:hypothetical protein